MTDGGCGAWLAGLNTHRSASQAQQWLLFGGATGCGCEQCPGLQACSLERRNTQRGRRLAAVRDADAGQCPGGGFAWMGAPAGSRCCLVRRFGVEPRVHGPTTTGREAAAGCKNGCSVRIGGDLLWSASDQRARMDATRHIRTTGARCREQYQSVVSRGVSALMYQHHGVGDMGGANNDSGKAGWRRGGRDARAGKQRVPGQESEQLNKE